MDSKDKQVLTLGVFAHANAGKTTITEHLLYHTGVIKDIGRVDMGNTVTDNLTVEKEQIELSNYASKVASSTNKYLAIDLKNPTKGLEDIESKVQARARLRIKNLRLENNKTQKDVAKYLSIDLSTYNKYEKGNRKLSNEIVKKIAEYYNTSISDIVD